MNKCELFLVCVKLCRYLVFGKLQEVGRYLLHLLRSNLFKREKKNALSQVNVLFKLKHFWFGFFFSFRKKSIGLGFF